MYVLGNDPLRGVRPVVSVVVSTRNRESFLVDLLDSLREQNFDRFEVIVVDDSDNPLSKKKIADIIREFSEDLKIKLLSNSRRLGIPCSLNRGILAAKGRIVAFTDDDCIADETWLEKLTAWYKYPDVGGVGGRIIPIEYDSLWIPKKREKPHLIGKILWDGSVVSNFDLDLGPIPVDCLAGANMSFRRDLLLKVGCFSTVYKGNAYRFETDLSLRIKKLGYKIIFDPNAIVYHRRAVEGGARLDAYKWNYWFSRNHTLFLVKCLPAGFLKAFIFFFKQLVRILGYKRYCPYDKPRKWHKVLAMLVKGFIDGLSMGLRHIYAEEELSNWSHELCTEFPGLKKKIRFPLLRISPIFNLYNNFNSLTIPLSHVGKESLII